MAATAAISMGLSTTILRTMSDRIIEAVYSEILDGVMKSFKASTTIAYGSMESAEGRLYGEGKVEIGRTSQVVDLVTRQSAIGAAILRRGDSAYFVEQTSIRDSESQRAQGSEIAFTSAAGKLLEAGQSYHGRIVIAGIPFIAALEPLTDYQGNAVAALMVGQSLSVVEQLTTEGYSAIRIQLFLSTIAAALGLGSFAYLFLRSSFSPLRNTVLALKSIAAEGGDLTRRIAADRDDEPGQLAAHFNAFIERLRGEFRRMKAETESLRGKALALERSARTSSSSVDRIGSEIKRLGSEVEVQTASVSEATSAVARIVRNIESLDGMIGKESDFIQSSRGSIGEITDGIAKIDAKVVDLVERVASLKSASIEGRRAMLEALEGVEETSRKSEVVLALNDLITDVASRTNILAINASIEAAHAGARGGGFIVIAEEVRRLAEESSSRADETGEGIREIRSAIRRLTEISGAASDSFTKVEEEVGFAEIALGEIAQDMASQRKAAEEAFDGLSYSSDSAKAILASSAVMKAGSRLIIDEMRNLLDLSQRVEIGIRAIAEEATTIAEESALTAEAARSNSQSVAALDAELAPYKTDAAAPGLLAEEISAA